MSLYLLAKGKRARLKGSHIHCNWIPQDIRSSWFLLIIDEWAQRTSELSSEINEMWYPMVSHYNKYENPFLTQFLNAFDAKIRKPSLFTSPLFRHKSYGEGHVRRCKTLTYVTFFTFARSLYGHELLIWIWRYQTENELLPQNNTLVWWMNFIQKKYYGVRRVDLHLKIPSSHLQ